MDDSEQFNGHEPAQTANNLVSVLRNTLDSLHEMPESVNRLESFSQSYKQSIGIVGSKEEEALFGVDQANIHTWLTRNDGVVDDPEEPPATIWPVRARYDEYLEDLNKTYRHDIINRQADTLSGAIGKLGSDFYVDAFRQAVNSYIAGHRLHEIPGGGLTWLWHDMTDGYVPDTEIDFHALLANELKLRFQTADAEQLVGHISSELVYDTFIMQAGDAGVFPGEVEKARMSYWNAANSAVKLFDTEPAKLTLDDYRACLDWSEAFADIQNQHPTVHGSDFTGAFASDIGIDARAVDAIMNIGSKFPYQIIRPDALRGQTSMFAWDIPKNSEEIPSYDSKQLTVLGVLGYLSALRQLNLQVEQEGASTDEVKTWLLELVIHEDFIPETNGDMAAKETILRHALGDKAVVF